jgi:hypothetical protein
MSYQPPQYPSTPPPYYAVPSSDSTDTIAMIVEIVFGLFGMLGMGWIYAGAIGKGILIFVGYLFLLALEVGVSVATGGICACLAVPVSIAAWVISGMRVRDHVRRTRAQGSVLNVVIAAIIAVIVLCLVSFGMVLLLSALGIGLGALSGAMNSLQ